MNVLKDFFMQTYLFCLKEIQYEVMQCYLVQKFSFNTKRLYLLVVGDITIYDLAKVLLFDQLIRTSFDVV